MWVGLAQSAEGLTRPKEGFPPKWERILLPDSLQNGELVPRGSTAPSTL